MKDSYLDDQVICQIVGGADLPNDLLIKRCQALTNSVTFQWQRSVDQLNWEDIDGQRASLLLSILEILGYQVPQILQHIIEEL